MKPTPLSVACGLLMLAAALFVAGVHHLAGAGWAMLAAALPVGLAGSVLARGAIRSMEAPTDG